MEEQVKELLDILKEERRMLVLHFMPGDEDSKGKDYAGIQWADTSIADKINSYPKEVTIKAIQQFVVYIVTKAMKDGTDS